MTKSVFVSLRLFASLTIITGLLYPFIITQVGENLFSKKASGSLVIIDNNIVGSELIGQKFSDPQYFWSRPSYIGNNPLPSGASNLGPTSSTLKSMCCDRNVDLGDIPADLLFASGSGLDPHISVDAAIYQAPRVAMQRGMSVQVLHELIANTTERRTLGVFGEERVNVLKLNIALDGTGPIYGK